MFATKLIPTAIAFLVLLMPAVGEARVLHKEKSLYRNISVVQEDGRRCLRFETRRRFEHNQSCIELADPKKLVFHYTRYVMAGLLVNPEPKRVLIIGLGGGSLALTFNELFPESEVVSVEIDPAVVKAARNYFNYEERQGMSTVTIDGRVYIKQQGLRGNKFDFIVLDAFNGDYIPEHLLTQEFIQETKNLLTEDGVLVANTFSNSKLYDYESVTYQSVFGKFFNLKNPIKGNRVIIASKGELPSDELLQQRALPLQRKLKVYSVDLAAALADLSREVDWDESKRILTDQYSPVNLLNSGD